MRPIVSTAALMAAAALLMFPQGVEGTLEADWRKEAEQRGYIIVSPASKVQGKLHVAGHSNGGLSAFHVAAKYPTYFSTVTGYPGLLDGPDRPRMAILKPLCLFMHVGDLDEGWKGAMQNEAEEMRKAGYRIRITVEPKQVHRLKAQEVNLSPRLFDEIESCR
jgi:hypothetical protein